MTEGGDRLHWVSRQSPHGAWIFTVLEGEEEAGTTCHSRFFFTEERGIEWAEEWICVKRAHRELTAMGQWQAAEMLRPPSGVNDPGGAVDRAYGQYRQLPSVELRGDIWRLTLLPAVLMIIFGAVIPAIHLAINVLH